MTNMDPAEAGASKPRPYDPAVDGHGAPGPNEPLVAKWLDSNLSGMAAVGRHDGWTPERKRSFHATLAEVGVVAEAARVAGMSARAAYNLRNRDPLFDAGWEAALLLSRRRLADELYARSVNGCVEQIHRGGAIVGERHRYDNRLSIAVLTRLDTRLDRALARGDGPVNVAARWDEYLDALGEDRDDDARALLEPPPPPAPKPTPAPDPAKCTQHREHHELHHQKVDLHSVRRDEDGVYWTDYPPPPGFDPAEEFGRYGDDDYERFLTPEEEEITVAAARVQEMEDDVDPVCHAQRDAFFASLRDKLARLSEEKDAAATRDTGEPETREQETREHGTEEREPAEPETGEREAQSPEPMGIVAADAPEPDEAMSGLGPPAVRRRAPSGKGARMSKQPMADLTTAFASPTPDSPSDGRDETPT